MYLRFVTSEKLPNMSARRGIFGPAYSLLRRPEFVPHSNAHIAEQMEWFEKNLKIPERFNRSKSKGAYRRDTKGLAWFRDNGNEAVLRGRQLAEVLILCDVVVEAIRTDRIGYVIYEDDFQAIAEPFASTPV
jgi:hypothetical protein